MRVIGTAGHVDHGKSTLIEALTGIHPDRLKEEKEREMTIDLGFAWLSLPSDNGQTEEIGIVDVPGHRDFIENMLAGIGGIDSALFVIAADEGVMPQTREHLSILDLLQINGGVIALTKIDMVEDPDWLDLVESDIAQVLHGTVLQDAPVVRVSARKGIGIQVLKEKLGQTLSQKPHRIDLGKPRLPVDRVFTIPGFGTVVTGTLTDGRLSVGEDLEILPGGLRGRVRGLQTHKQKEQTALPGSRTAINISGISFDEIHRGDVVTQPGIYNVSQRLDVYFRHLPDSSQPLKHNTEVKLYIGTAEIIARVRLLGIEELLPGHEGWLQLELDQPIVAARRDRYILRRPSPGETIGGGTIVDPQPKGRHKRFAASTIESLDAIAQGEPTDVVYQALLTTGPAPWKAVLARANLDEITASQAIQELVGQGRVINLDRDQGVEKSNLEDLLITSVHWQKIRTRIQEETDSYHKFYPLRRGLPREELKSKLKLSTNNLPRLFNAAIKIMVRDGALREDGSLIMRQDHEIQFSNSQEELISRLLSRFADSPYSPPSVKECQALVGEDVYNALLDTNQLTAVAPEVVFRTDDFEKMVADVRSLIGTNGSLTVAQARDHFNTSRRYVLAFLEYLDATGITIRSGDDRRLKR